jgi:hypothetical protein
MKADLVIRTATICFAFRGPEVSIRVNVAAEVITKNIENVDQGKKPSLTAASSF